MGKLVIINLVGGDFERGFAISLQIWTEGDNRKWIAEAKGKLPPARELLEHYKYWRLKYRNHVSGNYSARMSVTGGTDTTIISDIKKASKQLKSSLNDWLKADYDFSPIREKLFQTLKDEAEEIRVIFDTDNSELERLPWHLWDDFFKRYHRAEVALSLPVNPSPIATFTNNQVKVLAVFGRDTKINLQKDWAMLKKRLGEDSNAVLINVDKPSLENLCEQIEEHKPQILFFAGHSRSEESGENGFIDLNDEVSITIDDLDPELRKAVKWGLQLAIFNSCDGLGIARQLALLEVPIPNIIVMREPVPDELAQKFLQRFLEVFAWGKPLHLAVRRARERINQLEHKFPGATWLPMTFQNPAEPPLTWRALGGIEIQQPSNHDDVRNVEVEIDNASYIPWLQTFLPNTFIKQIPLSQPKSTKVTCKNGHENLSSNHFCIHCGVALTNFLICSKGHKNAANNKFCSFCGEPLKPKSTVIISTDESTSIQPPTSAPQPPSQTSAPQPPSKTSAPQPLTNTPQQLPMLGGRYKINRVLGRGGFGNTFIAQDTNLPDNPLCVVKQLRPVKADPNVMEVARRLFHTEAETQYTLGRHEQIPRILAHFEEKQEFYLVQEYIEGHDLTQELICGEKLGETQVIAILQDILHILEFVHGNNVIHRDIKPSNLIRREQDQKLVLIDFGAVKKINQISSNSPQATMNTIAIGTSGYAPAEQMIGKPSFSSDIYAVGMIGIEALTGICPYELPKDVETGEISWQEQAEVSDEVAAILNKMVRYDFRQRYQSAKEVLQALIDINRIIPTNTPCPVPDKPSFISGIKKFFKRFKS